MYRILYVDDEPTLLEIARMFLEKDGQMTVDTRTSAGAALPLIESAAYDAVISDYQMPGMDGIQFLKKVRESKNSIPFILFTGRGREEIVIQALNEGADFYLQKGGDPVSQFAELSNKIRYAVNSKRAEAIIREKTVELDRFFNSSLDLLCIADTEGNFRRMNPEWEHALGYPVSELEGKKFLEFVHPDDLALTVTAVSSLKGQEAVLNFENRYRHKDGTYRWLEWRSYPYGDLIYAAARDITDRKLAEAELKRKNDELNAAYEQITASEEELRQNLDDLAASQQELVKSESKYRDLFDNAILGIFRSTPDGRYLDMNPAFAWIAGFSSPREMMDKVRDIQQLYVRQDDRVRLREMLATTGEIRNFETEIRRTDGTTVWISINAKTARDSSGNILWYNGTIEDITARRHAEIELARRNEELQASHEQITATEEELRQNLDEMTVREKDLRQKTEELGNRNELIGTILDTTPVGIFMVEAPSGKPVMANREAARLLGRGVLPDATEQNLSEVYEAYRLGTGARYPTQEMPIIRGMRGEASHIDDMEVVRPDGTRIRLEVFGNPVRDVEGRIVGSLVTFLDITWRKNQGRGNAPGL